MTEKSKPRRQIGTLWFLACVLAVRVLMFDLTAAHNWWDWVGVAVDVLALLVVLGSSGQWDRQAHRDARKPWREAKGRVPGSPRVASGFARCDPRQG